MAKSGNKPGPKRKIDDAAAEKVFAILATGGSLEDAADYLQIDRTTLNRRKASDLQFAKGIDRAVAKGKVRLIQKIGKAQAWQAAAWMLERKWGAEFGKREHLELTGANGGKIATETTHTFDHDRFAELYRSRTRGNQLGAGPPAPNGN